MAVPIKNYRAVNLDDVRQNNIVWTDLNNKLSESIFESQFRKAAQAIQGIIEENELQSTTEQTQCRQCKSRNCASCKHRDRAGCTNRDIPLVNRTKCQTAIPFIGERGTGKTSVMYSVLEHLKCFRGYKSNRRVFDIGKNNDRVRFIAFDMIDANTLTSAEDVMEIILSRMLSYLEELSGDQDFRELYRQIDELHKNLSRVYGKKPGTREGYGLVSLQQIADSQKAIEAFGTLVRDFTREIGKHQFDGAPCYLVIALDDVDLYQGAKSGMQDQQFALLEQIYNHMRFPGLIVLLTFNEYILRRKCNDHFANIYFADSKCKPREHEYTVTEREDIEKLTAQFMSKLFPPERRIYLPNNVVVNTKGQSTLYVRPVVTEDREDEDGTRVYGEQTIDPFKKDEKELPVKEFMLRLIAHRTGVYFDATGTKQHFFEPRNLRELGELFQIVYGMEDPDKKKSGERNVNNSGDKKSKEQIRAENRQVLLEYFYNQFALKHLKTEEYREFHKLSMLPLDRQRKTLIDQIRQQRIRLVTAPDDTGYLAKTSRDRWKYGYGELLHNIYFATRVEKDKETIYSKEFIQSVLGTHSLLLNEAIRENVPHNKMMDIIGSSVAGRWANNMLPEFSSDGGSVGLGSVSMPVRLFFDWELPNDIQNNIFALIVGSEDCNMELLREYMESLVLTGMFFTSFPQKGLQIYLDPDIDDSKNATVYLRSKSNDHICFNALNFVINLYDAVDEHVGYLAKMKKKLEKLGREFYVSISRNWTEIREKAEREQAKREEEIRNRMFDISDADLVRRLNRSSYRRIIDRCKAWEVFGNALGETAFLCKWDDIVFRAIKNLKNETAEWQNNYAAQKMVLPIQHFDMMYNIIKRLASDSYYDKPAEAAVEDVYDYYVQLYRNLLLELEKQEHVYKSGDDLNYAAAFRNCVFYKRYVDREEYPYLAMIHQNMMRSVLSSMVAREKHAQIPLVDL
jgi:hypothetical protein